MSKEVIIYSAKWCAGCKTVKAKLQQLDIPYIEKDIDVVDVMMEAKELGIRNIPVTFVNGERFVGSTLQTLDLIIKEYNE